MRLLSPRASKQRVASFEVEVDQLMLERVKSLEGVCKPQEAKCALAEYGAALLLSDALRLRLSHAKSRPERAVDTEGNDYEQLQELSTDLISSIIGSCDEGALLTAACLNREWSQLVHDRRQFFMQRRLNLMCHLDSSSVAPMPRLQQHVGHRVVCALFFDRPQKWLAFSGMLELDDGKFNVAWDSAVGPHGLYELDYQRQRRIMESTGDNIIDPSDLPPMMLIPPSYPELGDLAAQHLIAYYSSESESDTDDGSIGRSSLRVARRAGRFFRPASLAENSMALSLAALTPYHEEKPISLCENNESSDNASEDPQSSNEEEEEDDWLTDDSAALREEVNDLRDVRCHSGSESDVVFSTDDEGVSFPRTSDNAKDKLKSDIQAFKSEGQTVNHFWSPEVVEPFLQTTRELADIAEGHSPIEAEDVVFSMDVADVAKHFYRLSNQHEYVEKLVAKHEKFEQLEHEKFIQLERKPVKLDVTQIRQNLKKAIGALSLDREGDNSLEACQKQADSMVDFLDEARQMLGEYRTAGLTRTRQGVDDQVENGDAGNHPSNQAHFQALSIDRQLCLKAGSKASLDRLDADALLHQLNERLSVPVTINEESSEWARTALKQLLQLPAIEAIKAKSKQQHGDHRLLEQDVHATLHNLSFPTGCQGKKSHLTDTFAQLQAKAIRTTSLLFRSLFGTHQSEFASTLLNAYQFRGSEWTTGTVISKGKLPTQMNNEPCQPTKASERRYRERAALLEELNQRRAKDGHEKLGFSKGEEGVVEVRSRSLESTHLCYHVHSN